MKGALSAAYEQAVSEEPKLFRRCRARANKIIKYLTSLPPPKKCIPNSEMEVNIQILLELILRNNIPYEEVLKDDLFEKVIHGQAWPRAHLLDLWLHTTWVACIEPLFVKKISSAIAQVHFTLEIHDIPVAVKNDDSEYTQIFRIMAHFAAPSSDNDGEAKMYHQVFLHTPIKWQSPYGWGTAGIEAADTLCHQLPIGYEPSVGYFTDADSPCAVIHDEDFVTSFVNWTRAPDFIFRERRIQCLGCAVECVLNAFCAGDKKSPGVLQKAWNLAISLKEDPRFTHDFKGYWSKILRRTKDYDPQEIPYYRVLEVLQHDETRVALEDLCNTDLPCPRYTLDDEDWQTVDKMHEFIWSLLLNVKLIGPSTDFALCDTYPTLRLLETRLLDALKDAVTDGDKEFAWRIREALVALNTRLKKASGFIYIFALYLNPTRKKSYWTEVPPRGTAEEESLALVDQVAQRFVSWNHQFPKQYLHPQNCPGTRKDTAPDPPEQTPEDAAAQEGTAIELDEYQRYLQEPLVTPATAFRTPNDLIRYWNNPAQREKYPTLSQVALNIVTIPAVSPQHDHEFMECEKPLFVRHPAMDAIMQMRSDCARSWLTTEVELWWPEWGKEDKVKWEMGDEYEEYRERLAAGNRGS